VSGRSEYALLFAKRNASKGVYPAEEIPLSFLVMTIPLENKGPNVTLHYYFTVRYANA